MNFKDTLMDALGIKIIHSSQEKVVASMPVDERTRQPFGLLHGGASVALAETAASIGAYECINKEKEICVGLEINANHIGSKRDGVVTATAIPLHKGNTTMVWEVRITDEQERLICISRCTMVVLSKHKN